MSKPEHPQQAEDAGEGVRAAEDALARLAAEIREARKNLADRLRAIREPLKAAGLSPESFLPGAALLDGPAPAHLGPGTIEPSARLFASPVEWLRSLRIAVGDSMGVIGPGNGDLIAAILGHCLPARLHLFDAGVDRLPAALRDNPAVTLHEGDPVSLLEVLPDESLKLAVVNHGVSHAESGRLLETVLAKLQPGGHLHVGNYVAWSILSGIPYGIPAAVNGLINRGAARIVGLVPHALGYHQIMLRKRDSVRPVPEPRVAPSTAPDPGAAHGEPEVSRLRTGFSPFIDEFNAREGRPPAVLDWTGERRLSKALPGVPVFAPGTAERDPLPYLDASVEVVAIPAGDPVRMAEARRVATAAVVEVGADRVTIHRLAAEAPPAPRTNALVAAARGLPLAGRSVLICSYYLPQPDCDSYSRRLFHLVGFLRDAGCEVTCAASNPTGFDAFSGLLTGRGVRVVAGLDPRPVADLAREGRFDWILFGFWNTAVPLLAAVRGASPSSRLIVDSGDVHFLRNARMLLRDADGLPGRLDDAFATAAAEEIDTYAAADAVLAVSRKEADLVAELIGDPARTFAVPDSEEFAPSRVPFAGRRGMFFVGNFEHPPNAEAIGYLCRRIVPHLDPALLVEHPIYVVGSNMSESVRAIASGVPGVRIVGWVPSVLPWLERTRVSLLPLLHGAGTKRKMIQALSIGTPTVTTSVGIEGFPLADGREVIVADDPVAFASGITRLLTDGELWQRLSAAGRETILTGHSHPVARERLLAALGSIRVLPRRSGSPRPAAAEAREGSPPREVRFEFRGRGPAHVVTRSPTGASRKALLISVVIPTRDRAALLRESLESLVGQSVDRDAFEVIVVNDGSTDGTAGVCREFAGRLRLTQVDGPPSGIGLAKNIGIEVAKAPIVLSFDDDDIADPGLVAAHLDAHERLPLEHVAVLGFSDWHPRLVKTELMRYVTDIGHYLFSYTHLRDRQLLDHTWFWGGRSSCKKSLIVRAGGFRPEFTFGSEDIEAGYRMSRMVARERFDAGLPADEAGLCVVFRRDAVQRVIRPMTFDEFCRRCERQGRSQWQFHRFHDDPAVRRWCMVEGAEARWDEAGGLLAGRVARVHELERLLGETDDAGRGPLRGELHELYRWTFDAFKAKGIVEEAARDAHAG